MKWSIRYLETIVGLMLSVAIAAIFLGIFIR